MVPLAPGFEDIEAVTIIDILRRAGVDVLTVGVQDREVESAHGVRIYTDAKIDEVKIEEGDAIVLPGGRVGTDNLKKSARIIDAITTMTGHDKIIAAICAAPTVLAKAGILAGRNATCYPGFENELKGAVFQEERVVIDGKIITSRGAGSAAEFALKIVELMVGVETSENLKKAMLFQ
jgi:4-methyl-5(b-hydroxyethyl)-thiazole monophosphate biosynthesis